MGETFYSILGVGDDADREAIRSAYREHVKETHPDVADGPEAGRRFKRITTARDVLLDGTERDRYDRLGHETYVRHHVGGSAWSGGESDATGADAASTHRRTRAADTRASTRGTATDRQATDRQRRRRHRRSRADGGYASEEWQTADDMYRRSRGETEFDTSPSLRDVGRAMLRAGPWIVVHAVLVVSAVATTWFSFTASADTQSITTFVFSLFIVSLVVALSLLHVVLRLYR